MRAVLGILVASLVLAACGDAQPAASEAEPTPTATSASPAESPSTSPAAAERDHLTEPPFGPDGFGQVTLGMSRDELLAVPGVRITGDNGVCEDFEAPGVRGHLQPGLGVAVLSIHADLETPEGIHSGSTLAEVRAAYPHGTYDDPWYFAPPYRFELGKDDRVSFVMLLLDGQRCGS